MSRVREKISFSEGGGGINIVFGPKYRPLKAEVHNYNEGLARHLPLLTKLTYTHLITVVSKIDILTLLPVAILL